MVGFVFGVATLNGYKKTTAVIERIESRSNGTGRTRSRSHDVYVQYTIDGEEYHGVVHEWKAGYREGKEITIYYRPYAPGQIKGDTRLLGFGLMIMGALVVFAGLKGEISNSY